MSYGELDYNNLINFSNILDAHILESESFFDGSLLNLIDEHLGYKSSALNIYDSNWVLLDGISHNLSQSLKDEYKRSFQRKDPFSKYISNNFETLTVREIKIVKSSDVFLDYKSCEYRQFLNSLAGLSYAAVIPFDVCRISFYKREEEGDFTAEEILFLNSLGKLLWSKYNLHSKITKPSGKHTLDELKNKYFDEISTGVIILDSRFTVLDYNNVGREFVHTLAPAMSIQEYFFNLVPLLNFSTSQTHQQAEKIVKFDDFIIRINLYNNPQSVISENGMVYFIIITNTHSSDDEKVIEKSSLSNSAFIEKYNLSPREMDIVIALSNGQKYQDIANTLFISINTVRTHVKNIYRKLEIDNQRNLLYMYNQFLHDEKPLT